MFKVVNPRADACWRGRDILRPNTQDGATSAVERRNVRTTHATNIGYASLDLDISASPQIRHMRAMGSVGLDARPALRLAVLLGDESGRRLTVVEFRSWPRV